MSQIAERIAALEERIAALELRASDDRRAMQAAADALEGGHAAEALGALNGRLLDDPRPASPSGRLHWLHVQDGDRLLWRLVAELVELHDAEATRLGRPTWKHHRPNHSDGGRENSVPRGY